MAAALAEMVAQFTIGRPAYAAVDSEMSAVIEQAEQLRQVLLTLVDEDERGFAHVTSAYRLPKATPQDQVARTAAVQEALDIAIQTPLRVMEQSCNVLALAIQVARSGNRKLASDAGCAALLGEAAVRAAGLNVLANAVLMQEDTAAHKARQQVAEYTLQASMAREQVMRLVDPLLQR